MVDEVQGIQNIDQKNRKKMFKLITFVISVVLFFILIIIKYNKETFSWYWVIAIIFAVIILNLIVLLFDKIKNIFLRFANKEKLDVDKLPPAITLEQAREIALKATRNSLYADYIDGCLGEKIDNVGKNHDKIYTYSAKGVYNNDQYFIIINMHYPETLRTILINPSRQEVRRCVNSLSTKPLDEPDVEESEDYDPTTGRIHKHRKTTRKKKENKEENKPKGDFE